MIARFTKIKILPRWIIVIIDMGISLFAASIAYLLRFNFDLISISNSTFYTGVAIFVTFSFLASMITTLYSGIIRYTGIEDGMRVASTTGLTTLLITILNIVVLWQIGRSLIPFSVIIIAFFVSTFLLLTYRLMVKSVFLYYKGVRGNTKNLVIFGAGDSGQQTNDILNREHNSRVVGFLEDDSTKVGKVLNGIRIYDAKEDIGLLYQMLDVEELIISVQNLTVERKKQIVDSAIVANIKVRNVPPVHKWIKGQLSIPQIKEINIEDLLGRDAINLNNYYISNEVESKSILITGAAGSIGSEIVRQLAGYKPKMLILFDQSETGMFHLRHELKKLVINAIDIHYIIGDVTNMERLEYVFEKFKPQIVFHAAAYKHVPMMEINSTEAVLCNVLGTRILAETSVKHKIDKFVYISTDKAVNPTNVMGASKRIGEMFIQSINNIAEEGAYANTKFITTRFGNVLGSNGSVIPLFKNQIALGGPVTVTHRDITRYFMTIPEACQLVLEAAAMGKGGEIFIFNMGDSVKIIDLAERMIRLSGFEPHTEIEIKYTGLREGEKLYEELLNHDENSTNTHHNKIMIAKVINHPFLKINSAIDEIVNLANNQSEFDMVQKMKDLVPEYISNESKFVKLDRLSAS